MKQRIRISREMLSYVGEGAVTPDWPAAWTTFAFSDLDGTARLMIGSNDDLPAASLVFAVDPAASERLFAAVPAAGSWHLPSDLRALAQAVLHCPLPEPARMPLRHAKSIELYCATMTRLGEEALVPLHAAAELSQRDAQRIIAARRLVDERWREKLTLDAIARTCGINRAKLTRGFRLLFDCSVADALTENRLGGAHRLLRETDLPVSSIGYQCGYGNNASFTRAFSRRFGMAPTQARRVAVGA